MKGKDEIKELFQKELGNYQAKVDPSLWNGIQAGLGTAGAATGVASSLGIVVKSIIGVSVAAAITVGTVLIVNNKSPQENKISITANNSKDSIENETVVVQQEDVKISSDFESSSFEKSTEKELAEPSQKVEIQGALSDSKNVQNDNSSFEEILNKESKSEQVIIYQEKPAVAPSIHLENSQIKKEETINFDLNKVNIQIVKQENQYVIFSADELPNDAQVSWNFGDGKYERSKNPEHFFAEAGIYDVVLTVQSGTQKVSKNIQIEIQMQGEVGSLPNVFTPNGDGQNDEFFIDCKNLKSFQLTVMDNNQNIVYSTNDSSFRWNGLDRNGLPVKDGNYIYLIVAEDEAGNVINKYQHLHIQR